MSSTADRTPEWDRLRSEHLRPKAERSESTARGMHHIALLCTDVEATIELLLQLVVVHDVAAPAIVFGVVRSGVGLAEQRLRTVFEPVVGEGDSNAHADAN